MPSCPDLGSPVVPFHLEPKQQHTNKQISEREEMKIVRGEGTYVQAERTRTDPHSLGRGAGWSQKMGQVETELTGYGCGPLSAGNTQSNDTENKCSLIAHTQQFHPHQLTYTHPPKDDTTPTPPTI